jgi:hypothetical protein
MRVEVKSWFVNKKCQLVFFGNIIVLTNPLGTSTSNLTFCGTNINTGVYDDNFPKKLFKPFNGIVTIENN